MEFESLIKEMEKVLMPDLERRAAALKSDCRFAEVRVASMRHAQEVHTIGLSCHPIGSSSPDDRYSIAVNIIGREGRLLMRGFVTWSQPYVSVPQKTTTGKITSYNNLSGYTIREGMTRPFKFQGKETLENFVALLPALCKAFDRGIRRGCPPGAVRRFWNRLVLSNA